MTLTELMIGLVVGLLVTLVGASAFLLARQGFATNTEHVASLDTGRVALDLLTRNVQMAGSPPFDPATFNANTPIGLPGGVLGLQGTEGGSGPDSLTVRYWSSQAYNPARMVGADCLGQAVGVGLVTNTFSIAGTGALACQGSGGATGQPVPVVENVVDLQIRYGLAATPEANSASRFADAAVVAQEGAWGQVRSVDICIEVAAADPRPAEASTPGRNCRGSAFAADRRLRRIFRATVNVRNATAGNIFANNPIP